MNIGITGARGFIGSHLLQHIYGKGLGNIRVLQRTVTMPDEGTMAEVVLGDLLSRRDCERFVEGLDVIFHLAHCNTPMNSDLDPPKDALLNLVPLLNLLQAIQESGNQPHIVYFSSGGAVYGRSVNRIPFRETDPCQPVSSYGIQKLAAEHYLRLASEKGYMTCTVLRVANAYGTMLPRWRMQGLIGVAVNNLLHNQPVRVFGRLDNIRDYVHLRDVCALAEKMAYPSEAFTVLNVGTGVGYTVCEILQIIQDCMGFPIETEVVHDAKLADWLTDWVVLDISKARDFHWTPTADIRGGICEIISHWRANTGPA